jgi:hypothetical protein
VLVAAPDAKDHPAYRAGVAGSFVATSTGFVGMAVEGFKRRRTARRAARPGPRGALVG